MSNKNETATKHTAHKRNMQHGLKSLNTSIIASVTNMCNTTKLDHGLWRHKIEV
jgi:hypothetical protein